MFFENVNRSDDPAFVAVVGRFQLVDWLPIVGWVPVGVSTVRWPAPVALAVAAVGWSIVAAAVAVGFWSCLSGPRSRTKTVACPEDNRSLSGPPSPYPRCTTGQFPWARREWCFRQTDCPTCRPVDSVVRPSDIGRQRRTAFGRRRTPTERRKLSMTLAYYSKNKNG